MMGRIELVGVGADKTIVKALRAIQGWPAESEDDKSDLLVWKECTAAGESLPFTRLMPCPRGRKGERKGKRVINVKAMCTSRSHLGAEAVSCTS